MEKYLQKKISRLFRSANKCIYKNTALLKSSLILLIVLLQLFGMVCNARALERRATLSSNANLTNLVISTGTLLPVFVSTTVNYTANVSSTITSIIITPTTADANASVTVNGAVLPSGMPSPGISLTAGQNIITIIVTSQDGTVAKMYAVFITRAGPDLANLTVSKGVLTPLFAPDSTNYTINLTNASVALTPFTADSTATVMINGNSVATGSASAPIPLNVGPNTITATVSNSRLFSYPASFPFRPFQIIEQHNKFTTSIQIKDLVAQRIAALKPFYVDYINGTDKATNGSSTGINAYKTISYALGRGASLIYLAAGTYLKGGWGNIIKSTPGDVFIIGAGADNTFITNAPTTATVWTNTTGNIYTASVASAQDIVDMAQKDSYGFPLKLQWVVSADAVAATPNSVYIAAGNITINLGRVPDANILPLINTYNAIYQRDAGTLYVEGITFMGGNGVLVQPNTILTAPTPPQLTSLFNNCRFLDAGNGLAVVYPKLNWANNCVASRTQNNGFSYSVLFNNTNYIANASFAIETNCKAFLNGEYPYTGSNANGSSAHYGVVMLRINCNYSANYGPNYIDVGNANASPLSLLVGCESSNSLGHFNGVKNGFNAGFAVNTSYYGAGLVSPGNAYMWLYKCTSTGDSLAYSVPDTYSYIYTNKCTANSPLAYTAVPNLGTITEGGFEPANKIYTVKANRLLSSVATLSNLTINSGALSPAFASGVTGYTASVANATTSITVRPVKSDTASTIKINGTTVTSGSAYGPIALNVGSNVITIIVVAQDGVTTTTYTINITRVSSALSANAYLIKLIPSSGALTPAFGIQTYNYTATVSNGTTSFTLSPVANNGNATIKVNGIAVPSGSASPAIPLTVGNNTITTITTAQDGVTTKIYTMVITRSPPTTSTNSSLANLTISSGTLSPVFATGTTTYSTAVANATAAVTVTPTTGDAGATVTVNGVIVGSGNVSGSIPLPVGTSAITVLVTAGDSVTTTAYTINVTRVSAALSANAYLIKLIPSSGTLTPAFGIQTYNYTATVSNGTASFTLTPVANNGNATIKVNGIVVPSGSTSPVIPLAVGSNTITTAVTAQDGITMKSYVIIMTRAEQVASFASSLAVNKNTEISASYFAKDGRIKVNQGVSPNGDGVNDVLLIENIEAYPDNKVVLINSDGAKIYETLGYDNVNKVFDGHSSTTGTMQQPGTYYYLIEYSDKGELKHKTGFIIIKY